jgi:hypothetical protein
VVTHTRSGRTLKINKAEIENVRGELIRRKNLLISFSKDEHIQMDDLDKKCIISFFEKGNYPERPDNIHHLMKNFFTSCFSYAPLRKYLTSIAGSIPGPLMLPSCLAQVFSENAFLTNQNWSPDLLHELASEIQGKAKYNLDSKQFKPRMISVLLSGTQEMAKRLENGLNSFYVELDAINSKSGVEMWVYVLDFSKNIYNVGPNLICDFIKGIGFERFVKVDHHFKREFPKLVGFNDCHSLSDKEHFVLSQQLADLIQMSPFHLDHLLYQWGRYRKYEAD